MRARARHGIRGAAAIILTAAALGSPPAVSEEADCAAEPEAVQEVFQYTTESASMEVIFDRLCFEAGWQQPLGEIIVKVRLGDWDDYHQTRTTCAQSEAVCRGKAFLAHGPAEVIRRYRIEYVVDSQVEPALAVAWTHRDCTSAVIIAWCGDPPVPAAPTRRPA